MPLVKTNSVINVIDNDDLDGSRPDPNDYKKHRIVEVMNNKIHFTQDGPYGFWTVHLDKGQLTADLANGSWTSFNEAMKDVKNLYIDPMREKVKEIIN